MTYASPQPAVVPLQTVITNVTVSTIFSTPRPTPTFTPTPKPTAAPTSRPIVIITPSPTPRPTVTPPPVCVEPPRPPLDKVKLTTAQMASRVNERMLKRIPCHVLKVDPKMSFPKSSVSVSWGCSGGRCTSATYQTLKFLDLAEQGLHSTDFKKVYFFGLIYKGGRYEYDQDGFSLEDQERFVGWQGYRVKRITEKFDAGNPGHAKLKTWTHGVEGDVQPYKRCVGTGPCYVTYEMCYRMDGEPYPIRMPVEPADRNTFSEGRTEVVYSNGHSPTYLGYQVTRESVLNGYIGALNTAETGLIFLLNVTPILGTACSVYECSKKPDLGCIAGAGIDATSDVLMLVGLGVPAKLKKVQAAIKLTQHGTIAANAGLSLYYATQNDWEKAIGRSVVAGVDIGIIAYGKGVVRYRSLRQTTADVRCADCDLSMKTVSDEALPAQCPVDISETTELLPSCSTCKGGLPQKDTFSSMDLPALQADFGPTYSRPRANLLAPVTLASKLRSYYDEILATAANNSTFARKAIERFRQTNSSVVVHPYFDGVHGESISATRIGLGEQFVKDSSPEVVKDIMKHEMSHSYVRSVAPGSGAHRAGGGSNANCKFTWFDELIAVSAETRGDLTRAASIVAQESRYGQTLAAVFPPNTVTVKSKLTKVFCSIRKAGGTLLQDTRLIHSLLKRDGFYSSLSDPTAVTSFDKILTQSNWESLCR